MIVPFKTVQECLNPFGLAFGNKHAYLNDFNFNFKYVQKLDMNVLVSTSNHILIRNAFFGSNEVYEIGPAYLDHQIDLVHGFAV